jgi:nucleoid-associated protein YgaU
MSDPLNIDPVQAILGQTALKNTLFAPNSRYYGIDTATLERPGAAPITYLLRRFLPPVSNFQVIQEHTVTQGERLDNLSAQFLGDATLFWRLADANGAMRAEALTETVGRKIRITLPEGITGTAL